MTVRALAVMAMLAAAPVHAAPPDELAAASVIFARGDTLYRSDGRGKQETIVATLPAKVVVRALRSDAAGNVLLADLGGKWHWMAVGGSKLVPLACGDGPAQLAEDGACVLCRNPKLASGSILINLKTNQVTPVAIPTPGARLITTPARKLVWTDAGGVWTAPPADLRHKTRVAAEAPLRSFIASPDGTRAFGTYNDYLYEGARKKVPAELLMAFALDGTGARRKAVQHGVPIDWSHDGQYLLVQDGSAACLVRATGGQYKCWKGFTAVSLAPDGSYALVLGNRDGSRQKSDKADDDDKAAEDDGDSDSDDDVPVPLPTGELALYAAKLAGPYSLAPKLVTKVVDGAALWLPKP
ncbi:MAG: hypothetical protein WKG01_28310 [Kofleriaceae bacterium]